MIFHYTKMLITFKLVLFVGTVGAIAYWGSVCVCVGGDTLCCDTVYLTDMTSGVSVPVTVVMYS
jgi:hypothetical protein